MESRVACPGRNRVEVEGYVVNKLKVKDARRDESESDAIYSSGGNN
jgi:hypothetical protein